MLPTREEVEAEEARRLGLAPVSSRKAADPIMKAKSPAAEGSYVTTTPQLANRRANNDLIRIDESQFVTLSQVQDNRVQTSSGRSALADSSIYTDNRRVDNQSQADRSS